MGFTHGIGISAASASGTTHTITLGSAPSTGQLVCVGMSLSVAVTAMSVKDANNNVYTVTPNSPSAFQTGAGQVWLAYLLRAPSNASATINFSWTTTAIMDAWADTFTVSGGGAFFDKDAKANTGTAGTTINTPSITPAIAAELLYATSAAGGVVSAPTSGSTLGVWTGSGGAIVGGDMSEYDLSASSATAVQFTQSSGGWACMAMAIGLSLPDDDPGWFPNILPIDSITTVWQ